MGTSLIDNFSYKGKAFLDARQSVATLAALRAVPATDIPDGFRAYCAEDSQWYEYNSENAEDPATGKWRKTKTEAPRVFKDNGYEDSQLASRIITALYIKPAQDCERPTQLARILKGYSGSRYEIYFNYTDGSQARINLSGEETPEESVTVNTPMGSFTITVDWSQAKSDVTYFKNTEFTEWVFIKNTFTALAGGTADDALAKADKALQLTGRIMAAVTLSPLANILNPTDEDVVKGYYQNLDGLLCQGIKYTVSGYTAVEPGKRYALALKNEAVTARSFRFVTFFDADKAFMAGAESVKAFTVPPGAHYARFSLLTDDIVKYDLCEAAVVECAEDSSPEYVEYGSVMGASCPGIRRGENDFALMSDLMEADIEEVTVANSDKIAVVGDSYTESHYAVRDKSYVSKLSLFSDYVFMNFGKSGDTYKGRLYDMRKGAAIYGGVPFAEYRPKFAMMCCFTNDIKYMDTNRYLESLQDIINVAKGIGSEPIVCTEYHTGGGPEVNTAVKTGLAHIAEKNGIMFWDIASYVGLIGGKKKYAPFWGGSHPGSRTNAMESDNYEKYLRGLERPAKSLKLFRPRGTGFSGPESLMFNTDSQRARLFKEISVGHSALNDPSLVDACADAGNSRVASEYQKLIEKSPLEFDKACLVSAVLPVEAAELTNIALDVKTHTGDLRVYVRNSMSAPYPAATRYTRFDYTSLSATPAKGAVYTASNDGDTRQFTVVEVVEGIGDGGAAGAVFCSPSDNTTNDGGTLTKVSGSGPASIDFSYRAVGYLEGEQAEDSCGHWVEIPHAGAGMYPVPPELAASSVYIDRVDFLLVCDSGGFTVSDIGVRYNKGIGKCRRREIAPFATNYTNDNGELLPSNTFGTAGEEDTNWGVTPTDIYEHEHGTDAYPVDCTSKVDVTDTACLECTVPASKLKKGPGKAVLEIWCRYFPPVYTDGTGNQITESSYDYNDIKVDIGTSDRYVSTLTERVNTHWKIVRFPVTIDGQARLGIRIYSDARGIEVAYVSLKYSDS